MKRDVAELRAKGSVVHFAAGGEITQTSDWIPIGAERDLYDAAALASLDPRTFKYTAVVNQRFVGSGQASTRVTPAAPRAAAAAKPVFSAAEVRFIEACGDKIGAIFRDAKRNLADHSRAGTAPVVKRAALPTQKAAAPRQAPRATSRPLTPSENRVWAAALERASTQIRAALNQGRPVRA